MSKNSNLHNAKRAKQDEFYTQWVDIEKEMNAYLDYNKDVFRDKTILLPCDDPDWSNFTKFFALHFQDYGIKKLISTSYAPKSNMEGLFYDPEPGLFDFDQYDEEKDYERGKIFVLDGTDENNDGKVNVEDFTWEYLEGDGDFRSDEIKALRDEADMVITNPPFSLFREFVAWLVEGEVEYSIIGSKNAITYKEIFPLIKDNKMWLGNGFAGGNSYFQIPESMAREFASGVYDKETGLVHFRNIDWFTNIQHGRRHEPLPLMSMEDNLRFNKRIMNNPNAYKKYDNYDAIEVPVTAGIPEGYTEERWVSRQEYEDLIHNGFHCEILEERERDLNPDSQPSNGSAYQIFGQVQPEAVHHHRRDGKRSSSTVCQEEGLQDIQQSSSGRQENLSEDHYSTQDKRVRILNPIMGVPISFLDKYSPEQFEIVGNSGELAHPFFIDGKRKSGRFYVDKTRLYDRIAIRSIVSSIEEK